MNLQSIEENLRDVAGSVSCVFFQRIFISLQRKYASQDDIHLLEKKDYIENPKPNGYRSLHLILEVPVFFANEKKWMPVEVQFRTIAMDFWASIEHKVKYKKNIDDSTAEIVEKLKECAEGIHSLDMRMQEISEYIDSKR